MKRLAALVLIILMMGTAMAETSAWRDGLGPGKPYAGLPEVDLSKEMGYMMFYPSAGMPAEVVCDRLYLYVPREDVKIGEGTLYLYSETAKNALVWSMEMDSEWISQRPISAAELEGLLWGGGTCVEINLPQTLTFGETYFVNMTQGSLVTEEGVESPAIGGTDRWSFTFETEYGVSAMEYRHPKGDGSYEGGIKNPEIGDEVRFDLKLGGEAATAVVYVNNNSVDFLGIAYEEDSEVVATVTAEKPSWGVLFLDAEGNVLDQIAF